MKVNDLLLCKKDKILIGTKTWFYGSYAVKNHALMQGQYYCVGWYDTKLVQIKYGTGRFDILLFNIDRTNSYGYESVWDYFYTNIEMRKIKLLKLKDK